MSVPRGNLFNTTLPVIQRGQVLVDDYKEKSVRQERVAVYSNKSPTPSLINLVRAKLNSVRPEIAGPAEVKHWLDELS